VRDGSPPQVWARRGRGPILPRRAIIDIFYVRRDIKIGLEQFDQVAPGLIRLKNSRLLRSRLLCPKACMNIRNMFLKPTGLFGNLPLCDEFDDGGSP
jgi:hypothetical protein